jgi:ABC-type glycerol-3-phosphate transport system substrate-binding protein
MKNRLFMVATASALLLACASPEERATDQIDTTENSSADSAGFDTVTSTGSMSGSNGTGTDTVDTKREKATRAAGNR